MPTKADLEAQITDLKHNLRRSERALNQALLDLEQLDTLLHSLRRLDKRLTELIPSGKELSLIRIRE